MTHYYRPIMLILTCCLFSSVGIGRAVAEDAIGPQADTPQKGLRVLFHGNSACMRPVHLEWVARAAGIEGHGTVRSWGARLLDGDWDVEKHGAGSPLEKGKVDALVIGYARWHIRHCEQAIEYALKRNPDFRVYVQTLVRVNDGLSEQGPDWQKIYDNRKIPDLQDAMDKARTELENKVEAFNRRMGRRVIYIVPVGDALVDLRAMIVEGKVPGIERQSQLFKDALPHPGTVMNVLAAYSVFAAMYGKSPIGIPKAEEIKLSDEQNQILQKLAWETVSKYSYAGIAAPPKPASPATPSAAAVDQSERPGAGASSLQDGIPAGWKSMGNGVPSDKVIKDYNDYIKKLPATERPGVADVRYYQDEKGQEGVAITIFVSGVTSIHFLSYDTAGKRLDVKQMKVDGDVK